MTDASAPAPLTPPATASDLVLAAPEPVAAIPQDKVGGMVPLDQSALPGLDKAVSDYVAGLSDLDIRSPAFTAKSEEIRTMGDNDIRAAAAVSNRMLDAPVKAIQRGGFDPGHNVSNALVQLRRQVEDLDPSRQMSAHKILKFLPGGDKLRDYFHRYESAQSNLNATIHALYSGQDELRKDNAALEQEKTHLWETMQRLAQYVYVADHLDSALETKIAGIEPTDADKAKAMSEDLLFYVRQKHQDLLTQLAVSIQGYLAIDLVRKNNNELIKGVDRATTTTVAALRTAVIVAQALANQKLVLDQVTAMNDTTSSLIETTSQLLANQSVAINQQAASATISIDKLQAAFNNIYQTMDAIDTFKVQALDTMKTTVDALNTEVAHAQEYLSRARSAPPDSDAGGLKLPGQQ